LCRSRKGKRACPALRQTICPVCCGRKRIVEIACPSDCVYLEKGSENDLRREILDYLHNQDPKLARRWAEAADRLPLLMETLERIVAGSPRAVDDRDLLAALEAARTTLDAEAKGVVFESRPTSPSAELLRQRLIEGLREFEERLRSASSGAAPRWSAEDK